MNWFSVLLKQYPMTPEGWDWEKDDHEKYSQHIKIFERGISELENELDLANRIKFVSENKKTKFTEIWKRVVNEINAERDEMRYTYANDHKFPPTYRLLGWDSPDNIGYITEKLARLESADYKEQTRYPGPGIRYDESGVRNILKAIPLVIRILNGCIAIAKRKQAVLERRWAKREATKKKREARAKFAEVNEPTKEEMFDEDGNIML